MIKTYPKQNRKSVAISGRFFANYMIIFHKGEVRKTFSFLFFCEFVKKIILIIVFAVG